METPNIEILKSFEEIICAEFRKGNINCPIHLSGGNEDQLIEIFKKIEKDDWVFSTHRNHYHYLLKGGNPEVLLAEIKGQKEGCFGGIGRSMNVCDKDLRFYATSIIGGFCATACGVALGIKLRGEKEKVWCFVGDGTEDGGVFYESVRYAWSKELPITFVIEDNGMAVESTKTDRWGKYQPIAFDNIIRYEYERTQPHCGVGEMIKV